MQLVSIFCTVCKIYVSSCICSELVLRVYMIFTRASQTLASIGTSCGSVSACPICVYHESFSVERDEYIEQVLA